jgi:enoyl-CoA hydratase/carnithine racemase
MASVETKAGAGLTVACERGIATITLARPEKRNALSRSLIAELAHVLGEVANEASARVIVLAADGPVFCSGHDLTEMVGCSASEYDALFSSCSHMMQQLRRLPQPVIARVQGHAVAAGCQLVAACDLAVAADTATFATPGVKIGLFCTTPMVPLVRAIPAKPALEMLLTGQAITAQRAYELGLVNRVVPSEQLDAAVADLAGAILASSPLTIQIGKAAFYDQLSTDEPTAYGRATEVMTENALKHDAQEGISAFLQKRKPHWTGE